MITMLQDWEGKVEVNGAVYDSIKAVTPDMLAGSVLNIKLYPKSSKPEIKGDKVPVQEVQGEDAGKVYRITVKKYMTEASSPQFDFMAKWNNNNPMPLRTMTGTILQETRGMVKMQLHGVGEPVIRCMRCGKLLSNPISKHYGIGPECMSKLGIVADISDVESIKEKLVDIVWTGWIIKSAITEQEEI